MSKILIIAEKPSLARNIAAAVSPRPSWISDGGKSRGGHYENDGYIVAYAFGHLLSLFDAEDYDASLRSWRSDCLPIIPPSFRYKVSGDAGARAQYRKLEGLLRRDDVSAVVNAGDSDREGEIIIRNILTQAGNTKPVYRLWMPDQTPRTIAAELSAMKSDSDYDSLAGEGYARTYIDWLYGINLTRMATVKSGRLLRVGRVTSPIVTAICERERAIRAFVPEKYWLATHDAGGLKLVSDIRCGSPEECSALCEKYNAAETKVTKKKTERKTMPRPRLFSLSDLQGKAGKEWKFRPQKTLDVLQKLYEAGYVSYPRTNSQYMATAEKQKAKDIIAAIQKAYPGPFRGVAFRDSKQIFDDSKIESHSGLTPTYSIPDVKSLPEDEQKIYAAVFKRFCSAFCTEDYTVDRTVLTVENGFEKFNLTGDIIVTPGYTRFEPPTKKQTVLPSLEEGDTVTPRFRPDEKETRPPDHYTAETLNNYLKNPYSAGEKKELSDDGEAMEVISEVELGTEATRAGLIDAAIKSGYITLSRNRYGITAEGEYYVDSLAKLGINMAKDRTLGLSKSLKQVWKGIKTVDAVLAEAESDLSAVCAGAMAAAPDAEREPPKPRRSKEKAPAGTELPELCRCFRCGGKIVEGKRSWFCSNPDCPVCLERDDRYFEKIGHPADAPLAKALLGTGKAALDGLVSSRSGKTYSAVVNVRFVSGAPAYRMEFPDRKSPVPAAPHAAAAPAAPAAPAAEAPLPESGGGNKA